MFTCWYQKTTFPVGIKYCRIKNQQATCKAWILYCVSGQILRSLLFFIKESQI